MGSMKRKADKPLDGKKPLKKKSKNGLSQCLQVWHLSLPDADLRFLQRSLKKKRSHVSVKASLIKEFSTSIRANMRPRHLTSTASSMG